MYQSFERSAIGDRFVNGETDKVKLGWNHKTLNMQNILESVPIESTTCHFLESTCMHTS